MFLVDHFNGEIEQAKTKALSACIKVEDVGSAMASMPYYLSWGVNQLAASGITEIVQGMVKSLDLLLTAVQALLLFVINMMTSTYTCLIAVLVYGGLNVSALVVEESSEAVNNAIPAIADDIGGIVDQVQESIDSAWSWIGDLSGLFGGKPTKPSLDITDDLNDIRNFRIDSSGSVSDINNINEALPTFKDVQNLTTSAVAIPFGLAKAALNTLLGDWRFNASAFPLAQKKQMTFCSNDSWLDEFFQDLYRTIATARMAITIVFAGLSIFAVVLVAAWERSEKRRPDAYHDKFKRRNFDDYNLALMGARPLPANIGLAISGWLFRYSSRQLHDATRPEQKRQETLVRWGIAYGTTLPAPFVLSLGVAGLFSYLCQYAILATIEREAPALEMRIDGFAETVVAALQNTSSEWAGDANDVLQRATDRVNEDVLQYVVNATDPVNNTLDTFTKGMSEALTDTFGDTILIQPITEIIYCLVGLKVEAVQKGLTWIHDHAQVTFPAFPNDTFSRGAGGTIDDGNGTLFLASSTNSFNTDGISGALAYVTDSLRRGIVQEAWISAALLGIYIVVILIAIVRILITLLDEKKRPNEDPDSIDAAVWKEGHF